MIYISVGHHVNAQGAEYKGITEYHLAGIWVDKIVKLLPGRAQAVPRGTLSEKVRHINANCQKGDIAIEIHFNSAQMWIDGNNNGTIEDSEMVHVGRGSETLYYPGSISGMKAAAKIQSALGAILSPDRGIKEGYYQMNKAKGPDFFLAKTKCVALIIEPEFIDNIEKIRSNTDGACASIASSLLEL